MEATIPVKRAAKPSGPEVVGSRKTTAAPGVAGGTTGKAARKAKSPGMTAGVGAKHPEPPPVKVIGVVERLVHNAPPISNSQLIAALRTGLPVAELDALRGNLDLPMDRLVPMLGISKATLHRRKATGKLGLAESDRVVRFARLLGQAASVMETIENGRRWLATPQVGLGGSIPLEYAETEVGARDVENLLGRIEYGVYS